MEKAKLLIYPLLFIILAGLSVYGGFWSFLIFPAAAILFQYLIKISELKPEIKTLIVGIGLFIIFNFWHWVQYDKQPFMFILIYSLAVMTAIEGWKFTVQSKANVWGFMNLIVLWIAMEYLMLLWLPFDVSGWLLGTPLLINEDASSSWLLYTGRQGYTLWVLLGGLLLYHTFFIKSINLLMLLLSLLVIILPFVFTPNTNGDISLYAQGEWIGRTCIWLSVLIIAYSFVKKKTTKRNEPS